MKRRKDYAIENLGEDELLAVATLASVDEAPALDAATEAKLMSSFRKSKSRVGASTTAAGTQIVELDDLPALKRRKTFPIRPWVMAAAATILMAVGWRVSTSARDHGVTGSQTEACSVTRDASGRLVLRGVPMDVDLVVRGERSDGTPVTLGPLRLDADGRLPEAGLADLTPGRAMRVTRSSADGVVVFEGVLPPKSSR